MHDHARNSKQFANLHLTFQHGDTIIPFGAFIEKAVGSMGLDKIHAGLFARHTDAFHPFLPIVRTHGRAFVKHAVQRNVDMLESAFRQQPHGASDIVSFYIIFKVARRCRDFHDAILLTPNNLKSLCGQPLRA